MTSPNTHISLYLLWNDVKETTIDEIYAIIIIRIKASKCLFYMTNKYFYYFSIGNYYCSSYNYLSAYNESKSMIATEWIWTGFIFLGKVPTQTRRLWCTGWIIPPGKVPPPTFLSWLYFHPVPGYKVLRIVTVKFQAMCGFYYLRAIHFIWFIFFNVDPFIVTPNVVILF